MTIAEHRSDPIRRHTVIRAGASAIAFVSGTVALVAMLVGSPLQFGLALAVCGAGWIVMHFADLLAEQDRAAHSPATSSARLALEENPARGYGYRWRLDEDPRLDERVIAAPRARAQSAKVG